MYCLGIRWSPSVCDLNLNPLYNAPLNLGSSSTTATNSCYCVLILLTPGAKQEIESGISINILILRL